MNCLLESTSRELDVGPPEREAHGRECALRPAQPRESPTNVPAEMGWLVRVALCALAWVLGIVSAFVGIVFVSLPGMCEDPGHSCGGWWVPAGIFF
jgi:hypothetical protein